MIKRFAKLLLQLLLIILCVVVVFYFITDLTKNNSKDLNDINKTINDQNLNYNVYFCPEQDCNSILYETINKAKKIDCAIYDITLPWFYNLVKTKDTRIIIDNDQLTEDAKQYDFIKTDKSSSYMHNKLCIFDNNTLLIGSINFTLDAVTKQNNNFIITNDSNLINLANQYFNELWNGNFKNGFNYINFCSSPSNCMQHYIDETKNSNNNIKCMFFSFTYADLTNALAEKQKDNLDIKIILEKSQNSQYNQYSQLKDKNINVIWDANPSYMHNKFCVFDSNVVITGSMNPSNNGNTNNNESIIIINNKEVAKEYESYFNKYYSKWS